MFDWMKKRRSPAPDEEVDGDAAKRHGRDLSGTYSVLYQYLEGRYANTVFLTFAQIEDLLGFTLPDRARTDQTWWAAADTDKDAPGHSHAWTLTRRTAKPNLLAQNVVFDRSSS